jgi:NAD(P)H dehydrogenase (quinone)
VRTLVAFCHPVPYSYGAHLRDQVLSAVDEVRLVDLYGGNDLPRRFLDADGDDLAWAEAVVLVYPTWWSSLPAPLMEWVEAGLERDLWRHLVRVVAVTTHGSSRLVNIATGQIGRRIVRRGLPAYMASQSKGRFIALYRMDGISQVRRRKFAEHLVTRLPRALT